MACDSIFIFNTLEKRRSFYLLHVEAGNGGDPTYHCSTCDFRSECRTEFQSHLDSSGEIPDVQKLLAMDVQSAIIYALKFPKW